MKLHFIVNVFLTLCKKIYNVGLCYYYVFATNVFIHNKYRINSSMLIKHKKYLLWCYFIIYESGRVDFGWSTNKVVLIRQIERCPTNCLTGRCLRYMNQKVEIIGCLRRIANFVYTHEVPISMHKTYNNDVVYKFWQQLKRCLIQVNN